MTPDTFLKEFGSLAETTGGISKLRALVLELAIRGKITGQLKSDGSGLDAQTVNSQRYEALVEQRVLRRSKKEIPAVDEHEQSFVIPQSWVWTRFGTLGDWGAGATPSRSRIEYYDGTIPWFKSGELNDGHILSSQEQVTPLALEECSLRVNQVGDVVVAMYGATIGRTAILDVESTTNQAVCACTCFDGLYNEYLLLTLRAYRDRFIAQGEGGAQPNISKIKIIRTPVPLPPLPEQKRIVKKVAQLMALCDELETKQKQKQATSIAFNKSALNAIVTAPTPKALKSSWSRVQDHFEVLYDCPQNVKELRQTILQLAVMGKLVKQDPKDEPAEKLLERVSRHRLDAFDRREFRRMKPPAEPLEGAEAFGVPPGWSWAQLGELCFSVSDGPHHSPKYVEADTGVPMLSTRHIASGILTFKDLKYVSESDYCEYIKRGKPERGDVLFSKGGTTGVAVVNSSMERFCVWVHIALLKIDTVEIDSNYVALALNSPHCFWQSQKFTHGIGNKDLGLTRMVRITVPIPPLLEQKRILRKTEGFMALCDELEAILGKLGNDGQRLMRATVESLVA